MINTNKVTIHYGPTGIWVKLVYDGKIIIIDVFEISPERNSRSKYLSTIGRWGLTDKTTPPPLPPK